MLPIVVLVALRVNVDVPEQQLEMTTEEKKGNKVRLVEATPVLVAETRALNSKAAQVSPLAMDKGGNVGVSQIKYLPVEEDEVLHDENEEQPFNDAETPIFKRMVIDNGMTALDPTFQRALGELSVWAEVLFSHYSFLSPGVPQEEIIEFYENSESVVFRMALASISPNSLEAIHLWERDALGRLLDVEEAVLFMDSNEFYNLYQYSVSLDAQDVSGN